MNRYRAITVTIAIVNLALAIGFPPFDYVSPARSGVPTFEGFAPVLTQNASHVINMNFLQIELIVIVANAAIAWLLLKDRSNVPDQASAIDWQRVVLYGVSLNLLLALLFPPMEHYYAVTRAALPSFDGFYFLFGPHSNRSIVTAILYIEIFVILINGALLYFLFRRGGTVKISQAERAAMVDQLQRAADKGSRT